MGVFVEGRFVEVFLTPLNLETGGKAWRIGHVRAVVPGVIPLGSIPCESQQVLLACRVPSSIFILPPSGQIGSVRSI